MIIKNQILIIILLLYYGTGFYAQKINVRVFSAKEVKSVVFTTMEGEYDIIVDTITRRFDINNVIQVSVVGEKISVRSLDGNLGECKIIKLTGRAEKNTFKIKPNVPDLKPRIYDDNLIITLFDKQLLIVNEVELESYIAGVVESEGGYKAHTEFYKTQAVLCRTWALYNIDKHVMDGYQLCDDVHCQVYHSKCQKNDAIINATVETEGLVLIDTSQSLITATFHSNCGGQTVKSEDIWGKPKSYLQSVNDSFCIGARSSYWEKKISIESFKKYLRENGFKINGDTFAKDSLIFYQAARKAFFSLNNDSLHLKKMRSDLKLKSTFFSVYKAGNDIIFKGRGYGHGVGLCQEGAMRMAKLGYNYQDIVKFYFKNTSLVSLKSLNFFNASVSSVAVPKDTLQPLPVEKPVE
ncbi:MAG: SpoIID/LytB domain-containing protein [Bacteroidia bacterium]|nr:SpoIID/LytB domain-containing protein [Bacteroidia bacterium]